MYKQLLLFVSLLTFAIAIPIDRGIDLNEATRKAALNSYLYGEADPAWLKYVDKDGKIDYSKVQGPANLNLPPPEFYYNAQKSVKFYVYTRAEPTRKQVILEDLESIKNTTFNPKKPIRILIHGWQNDEKSDMIQVLKKAYLEKDDLNVISVDWGNGAGNINYYTSRHRVGDVSEVVIRFIEFIAKNLKVKTSQIQIIGHSLGAHIAGLTGKNLKIGRIPVIVGLDPASPLFSFENPQDRIDTSDGEYVEVIHTAAGSLGFDLDIGVSDFYPNFGRSQPGCGLDLVGTCAHSRAYEYFAESINSDTGFWSNQCGEYKEIAKKKCNTTGVKLILGGHPIRPNRPEGVYHLETNKKQPFAKGD